MRHQQPGPIHCNEASASGVQVACTHMTRAATQTAGSFNDPVARLSQSILSYSNPPMSDPSNLAAGAALAFEKILSLGVLL